MGSKTEKEALGTAIDVREVGEEDEGRSPTEEEIKTLRMVPGAMGCEYCIIPYLETA